MGQFQSCPLLGAQPRGATETAMLCSVRNDGTPRLAASGGALFEAAEHDNIAIVGASAGNCELPAVPRPSIGHHQRGLRVEVG